MALNQKPIHQLPGESVGAKINIVFTGLTTLFVALLQLGIALLLFFFLLL